MISLDLPMLPTPIPSIT